MVPDHEERAMCLQVGVKTTNESKHLTGECGVGAKLIMLDGGPDKTKKEKRKTEGRSANPTKNQVK